MSKKYLDTVGLNKLVANILSKFAAKNHSHSNATTNSAGFMSSSDKVKLDGVSTGANRTIVDSTLSSTSVNAIQNKAVKAALDGKAASSHTHPTAQITGLDAALAGKAPSSHSHSADNITSGVLPISRGGTGASNSKAAQYNIMKDVLEGTVNASDNDIFVMKHHTPTATNGALLTRSATQVWTWIKSKCDALYQPRGSYASSSHTHTIANVSNLQSTLDSKASVSHTHSNATATASGFMSNTDKSKLDGVAVGANKTIVDSSLNSTSTNAIQNKAVKTALDGKAASSHTHPTAQITGLDSALAGKASASHKHNAGDITSGVLPISSGGTGTTSVSGVRNMIGVNPITTTGSGSAYVASVPHISTLVAGATFTMVPHVVSAAVSPTLNVNNLGAKPIRQRLSNSTLSTAPGATANWLAAGKPVDVMYDGQFWVVDFVRPNMASAYGVLPVENGGVPSCTTSDNGKFLRVVNGVAAWSAIASAENASF